MSAPARRIRVDLAYDGTDFAGWQVQPGERTVQGVLAATLARIQGEGAVTVRGAGRTDAGVHAAGQVADALIATRMGDDALLRALASLLPPDARPLALRTVPEGFHSRFDARAKRYVYRLDRTAHGDPFRARFALHHPHPIDRAALDAALVALHGRHDWSSFAGAACDVADRERTVSLASYREPEPGTGEFTFAADGFLNHMVRNLVGTLLEVARGKIAPERIAAILAARDRTLAGPTALARGLCLVHVDYDAATTGERSGLPAVAD